MDDVHEDAAVRRTRRAFWVGWGLLALLKLGIAWRLPLFVDEAFYWQEGQHLDWAYSDLPGLTAWLTRLGTALFGHSVLGVRLPFLLIGALLPCWLVRLTAREFGPLAGWRAGLWWLLLPLAGTLGLLALPDVPLLLATLLCLDACLRLLRRIDWLGVGELAAGLLLGGLTHYRFAAVLLAGGAALLMLREGRALLRQPKVWLALAVGVLAWLPLLGWNLQHAEAGLRFQVLERNPWTFSLQGLRLGAVQLILVTPLLLLAMLQAAGRGLRDPRPAARYLALSGGLLWAGFFVLGFFADRQRVSFHWPLAGQVALLPLLPWVLSGWSRGWRVAAHGLAGLGLLLALAYALMAATAQGRAWAAGHGFYPGNFSDWQALAQQVRLQQAGAPPGTRLLAADFKLGAELGFVLKDPDIPVLDHPLNRKHGRQAQLALWGLLQPAPVPSDQAWLVVANPAFAGFADEATFAHWLSRQLGGMPTPQMVTVDAGAARYWLVLRPAAGVQPATAAESRPGAAGVRLQSGADR